MNDAVDVTIWSDKRLALGEGPLTHHQRSSLIWCDIIGSAVYEQAFDGTETRKFDLPVMPSAFGIIDGHSVLVATDLDLRRLNLDTGATDTITAFPEDDEMRANDGRTHPSGAFWIGTMAKDGRGKPGAIYRFFDGTLSKMIDQVVTPNSICFAADGSFAYYADTPARVIWKIPTDPDTGDITGAKTPFVTFDGSEPGSPDGSVVDADGQLWNARWGGNAVDVYDADGVRLHSYHVASKQPTCPSFIGDNLDRIVTTSAAVGIDAGVRNEADGKLLEIHAPVRGRREPVVRM